MAFAFQVFFDFAGYSDVAIGLALIFGIQLPRNFDAPFRSHQHASTFWQPLAHDAGALPARLSSTSRCRQSGLAAAGTG